MKPQPLLKKHRTFCLMMQFFVQCFLIFTMQSFKDFLKIPKHRANDASNDVHRPHLVRRDFKIATSNLQQLLYSRLF